MLFFSLFTTFPLSGIYNIPAEVERHTLTSLSYLSYFKLKVQCSFHLEKILHRPFTRPLQASVRQDLSDFQFAVTEPHGHKEEGAGSHPSPAGGQSHQARAQRTKGKPEAEHQFAGRTKTSGVFCHFRRFLAWTC